MTPALGRAEIAARLPHAGRMCLLDAVQSWDAAALHASAAGHRAPDHPLRSAGGLLAPCAIEYAAQAMALHGALLTGGDSPRPGLLASVRGVRFAVPRLDTLDGDLQIHAERLAGDERQVMYAFRVDAADGRWVAQGRATVVLQP